MLRIGRRRFLMSLHITAHWGSTVLVVIEALLTQGHAGAVAFRYSALWRKEVQPFGGLHCEDLDHIRRQLVERQAGGLSSPIRNYYAPIRGDSLSSSATALVVDSPSRRRLSSSLTVLLVGDCSCHRQFFSSATVLVVEFCGDCTRRLIRGD